MFHDNSNNDAVSLLILWGREHFFDPFDDDLAVIERTLQALVASSEEPMVLTDEVFNCFEVRVNEALSELSSELTLNLDPDDAMDTGYGLIFSEDQDLNFENIYQRIVCALQTLDDVVYLNHALHHFPDLPMATGKNEEVLNLLDRIVTDDRPSALRLIPLNAYRQDFIANIPERLRYLFPWYEEFSDLPEDALSQLSAAIAGDIATENISPGYLELMLVEIQNDPALLETVLEDVEIINAIPSAIKQAYAIRWIETANKIAAIRVMPEEVSVAGSMTAAIRAVAHDIINKKQNAVIFYAGFCGLHLDRDQRNYLLKPFEERLKAGNLDLNQPLFAKLHRWQSGDMTDEQLAHTMLDGWMAKLIEAASETSGWEVNPDLYWKLLRAPDIELAKQILSEQPVETESVAAEPFLAKISDLLIKSVQSTTDVFMEYFKSIFEAPSPMMLKPAIMQGDSDEAAMPIRIDIGAPVRKIAMPAGRNLLFETDIPEFASHSNDIIFYCGGVALTTDGEIENIPTRRGRIPFRLRKETSEYQSILLIISGDRSVLEKLLTDVEFSGTSAEGAGGVKDNGMIWIHYVSQKN